MSAEEYALVLIPKFAGVISMTFSSIIVYCVMKKIRRKTSTVYDRLIMGMSCSDMLSSISTSLSTWPIPASSGVLWAVGNQATCNLQGFFACCTVACPIYNASLSFYHLLVVRYNRKNQSLEKCEKWFHIPPLVWAVSVAIAGLPLKLYNNATLWCFIAASPDEERGQHATLFRLIFFYGPLSLMIVIVTVNMVVVYCYVRKVTTRAIQHSRHSKSVPLPSLDSVANYNDDESSSSSEEEDEEPRNSILDVPKVTESTDSGRSPLRARKENRYVKWRRAVALQNLMYGIAFYWTWTPIIAVRFLQMLDRPVPFWVIALAALASPMQGLPNVLIYFYPKIIKFIRRHNETGEFSVCGWIKGGEQTSDLHGQDDGDCEGGSAIVSQPVVHNKDNENPKIQAASPKHTDDRPIQIQDNTKLSRSSAGAATTRHAINPRSSIIETHPSQAVERVERPQRHTIAHLPSTSSITISRMDSIEESMPFRHVSLSSKAAEVVGSSAFLADEAHGRIPFSPLRAPRRSASPNRLRLSCFLAADASMTDTRSDSDKKAGIQDEELLPCTSDSKPSMAAQASLNLSMPPESNFSDMSAAKVADKDPMSSHHRYRIERPRKAADSAPSLPGRLLSEFSGIQDDSETEETLDNTTPSPADSPKKPECKLDSSPRLPGRPVSELYNNSEPHFGVWSVLEVSQTDSSSPINIPLGESCPESLGGGATDHQASLASSDFSPCLPRRLDSIPIEDNPEDGTTQHPTISSSSREPKTPPKTEQEEDCEGRLPKGKKSWLPEVIRRHMANAA